MSKAKWAQVLLLVESAVLMIALIMPVTPSKTGGDVRLAKYFVEQPTYLHEVVLNVILLHLIIAAFALVFLAFGRKEIRGGDSD
jgi:prolipoprotein diacylglyceryltransferase